MEPFSASAAAIGLASLVCSVSVELAKCINTMRLADRDAERTQLELAEFGFLLEQFDSVAPRPDQDRTQPSTNTRLRTAIMEDGSKIAEEMGALLDHIGILKEKNLQTALQRGMAKFRWYVKKSRVLHLCVQFNHKKVSMIAFISSVGLESVQTELREMRERLKLLLSELKELRIDRSLVSGDTTAKRNNLRGQIAQFKTKCRRLERQE
ncbi:hypothetical protein MPH_00236 [Macrophomina phaseolina MS6]|uniref:Fungal N-terminal domain-containing protein n=1 Tax=Macrophomina phaseolina (strain MS6) TaxID=1126212 RepID=K2RIW1_MACPH|nr:hypothetical protein MPH_00236 [Macrophomina phaseolina MS6]